MGFSWWGDGNLPSYVIMTILGAELRRGGRANALPEYQPAPGGETEEPGRPGRLLGGMAGGGSSVQCIEEGG